MSEMRTSSRAARVPSPDHADRDASPRTRERLLRAAEILFARRGYRGTSIRGITSLAGCNLAAVNYHFGGKLDLYREMFQRRLGVLREQRASEVRRALDALGGKSDLEAFLRAFTTAFLEPHLDEVGGGRRLMQLFSRELLEPHLPPSTLRRELVRPVREGLIEAIGSIGIDVSGRAGRRCIESLVAQLVHVVRMRQAPHVSGATGRADFQLDGMIEHIVRFSAAGVRACVGAEKRR
jgi:AcrR family transcriptional regulator